MKNKKPNRNVCVFVIVVLCMVFISGRLKSKAVSANEYLIKASNEGVPVLMYHSIDNGTFNPWKMPKETFDEQMKFIKDNHYTTLTLDELYGFLEDGKPIPKKSVVVTLDDGYRDNYTNAYPILKKYRIKATIFVIANTVNKSKGYLTSSEISEMSQNGIDFESHTVHHEELDKYSYVKQLNILITSKKMMEGFTGKKVNYLAYPYGDYNEDTVKAAKEAGYKMAFLANGRWSHKDNGIYTLQRIYVCRLLNLREFNEKLTNPDFSSFD